MGSASGVFPSSWLALADSRTAAIRPRPRRLAQGTRTPGPVSSAQISSSATPSPQLNPLNCRRFLLRLGPAGGTSRLRLLCRSLKSEESPPIKPAQRFANPTWQSSVESVRQVLLEEGGNGASSKSINSPGSSGADLSRGKEQDTECTVSAAELKLPKNGAVVERWEGLLSNSATVSPSPEVQQAKDVLEAGREEAKTPGDAPGKEATVIYVLRLGTSNTPGSGITERNAGVQVAVIGQSGRAISARVYPSPADRQEAVEETPKDTIGCEGLEPAVKAAAASAGSLHGAPLEDHRRRTSGVGGVGEGLQEHNVVFSATGEGAFREGGKAVVCLQAPDVRPVAALWVAPLGNCWRLSDAALGVLGRGGEFLGGKSRASPQATAQEPELDDRNSADSVLHGISQRGGEGNGAVAESVTLDAQSLKECVGTLYVFKPDKYETLGSSSSADALAVELRPWGVRNIQRDSLLRLLEGSTFLAEADASLEHLEAEVQAQIQKQLAAQQESMAEYSKLKEWLLLCTSAIIVVGTAAAAQIGGENTGAAFAAGGLASLLFLFKLQRQVDSLQAPPPASLKTDGSRAAAAVEALASGTPVLEGTDTREAVTQLDSTQQSAASVKVSLGPLQVDGPVLVRVVTIGLCFGVVLLLLSQGQGGTASRAVKSLPKIEPEQMLAAFLGFLSHKVSVVLAAFRRSPRS